MQPLVAVCTTVAAAVGNSGAAAAASVLMPLVLVLGFFDSSPIQLNNFYKSNFIASHAPWMMPK